MKIEQARWTRQHGWQPRPPREFTVAPEIVFAFGGATTLREACLLAEVAGAFPAAQLMGCSTAGEIYGTEVSDDALVVTAVGFDRATCRGAHVAIGDFESSYAAGSALGRSLCKEHLVHVFVLSDGLEVNGSELTEGLTDTLPETVTVTGGLSGDGDRFGETLVIRDGTAQTGTISAVGFYGPGIRFGFGSLGGWDPFGPERLVTRSEGNVLYELEGRSALALYKEYLGDYAEGLPATGLLFPLAVRMPGSEPSLVRTILSIDEERHSLTFAGDVPEGAHARLMKANFDRLIDGAIGAASSSAETLGDAKPELALLISCVGRKMVLKQRVEEEVEGVREVLGNDVVLTGFYSYGEISPVVPVARCELHNQTMTITTLSER